MDSSHRKIPNYKTIDGLRFAGFVDENVRQALNYKPRPGDFIVSTYPKCGTTWAQQIIQVLSANGVPPPDGFGAIGILMAQPFIEAVGTDPITAEGAPRTVAIKTHLPFDKAPWSDEAKYLCVARNPLDCCVSFYNHSKLFDLYEWPDGEFDVFFELFINGKVDNGDYFEYLRGWWAQRDRSNVKWLTYEDMKRDPRTAIEAIADFMNPEIGKRVREDKELLENVVKYSSFEYMSSNVDYSEVYKEPMTDEEVEAMHVPPSVKRFLKSGHQSARRVRELKLRSAENSNGRFIRKGQVKDWKNVMSAEQAERLRDKFRRYADLYGIDKIWSDLDWMN